MKFLIFFWLIFFIGFSQSLDSQFFRKISREKEPKYLFYKKFFDSMSSKISSINSISQLKNNLRRELTWKINICYKRFKQCSEQFSASFCSTSTENISFYIWARNAVQDILNGYGDEHSNVKCSPRQVQMMVKFVKKQNPKNQRMFTLWLNNNS